MHKKGFKISEFEILNNKPTIMSHLVFGKRVNILLFAVITQVIYCLIQFEFIECVPKSQELLLLNVFNRHGDRAPVKPLPPGDKHAEDLDLFWPNGLVSLCDNVYRLE